MNASLLETALLICPDDRGRLAAANNVLVCQNCRREYSATNAVWELLPFASLDKASTEGRRLESYRAGYSQRPDGAMLQWGRVLIAELGNAYLYAWASRVIETVSGGLPLRILDAGCGDGLLWRHLPRRHHYVGSDFSARPLARASRYHPAEYFRADLNRLPFASASFDLVVSLQALQYLDRPERAVQEVHRVLRPGGHFVCPSQTATVSNIAASMCLPSSYAASAGRLWPPFSPLDFKRWKSRLVVFGFRCPE